MWKQVLRSAPLLPILLQLTELDTILSLRATILPLILLEGYTCVLPLSAVRLVP